MARVQDIAIDLDSLTPNEWAAVAGVAEQGGIDPATVTLAQVRAGVAPVPVVAGIIYVTMRRTSPRITQGRCIRLAQQMIGGG